MLGLGPLGVGSSPEDLCCSNAVPFGRAAVATRQLFCYNYTAMDKPNTIIFIGPQGSGKGTQAKILAQKLGAEYIEMGALLRKVAAEGSDFGREVKSIIDAGILVDDEMWYRVIKDKLESLDASTPAIFDGSPRRIGQAHMLIDHLNSIGRTKIDTLFITLPREESIRRLLLRRICENCKTPTVASGDPNQVCAVCGGKLIQRADENEAAIKKRLELYEQDTVPVISYLKEVTNLHEIDGTPDIADVTAEIDKALGI